MSNELYRKLQSHVQEREMANVLSAVSNILYAEAARDIQNAFPFEKYKDVYSITRQPVAGISIDASLEEQKRWIDQLFVKADVKEDCYVSLSDFRFAPWFCIRTKGGAGWVMELRPHLQHFDVKVLSLDLSLLLTIDELELEYAAFINVYDEFSADARNSRR